MVPEAVKMPSSQTSCMQGVCLVVCKHVLQVFRPVLRMESLSSFLDESIASTIAVVKRTFLFGDVWQSQYKLIAKMIELDRVSNDTQLMHIYALLEPRL